MADVKTLQGLVLKKLNPKSYIAHLQEKITSMHGALEMLVISETYIKTFLKHSNLLAEFSLQKGSYLLEYMYRETMSASNIDCSAVVVLRPDPKWDEQLAVLKSLLAEKMKLMEECQKLLREIDEDNKMLMNIITRRGLQSNADARRKVAMHSWRSVKLAEMLSEEGSGSSPEAGYMIDLYSRVFRGGGAHAQRK